MKKYLLLLLTLLLSGSLHAQSRYGDTTVERIVVDRTPELSMVPSKARPGYHVEQLSDHNLRFSAPEELVPLTLDRPFVAIGTIWTGNLANDHQAIIEVRGSRNTREWSEWMVVEVDHHANFEDGRKAGVLIFFPKDTQYVQYRATLRAEMVNLQPTLDTFSFHFINPGVTPEHDLNTHKATVKELVNVRERISAPMILNKETEADGVAAERVDFDLPVYVDRANWGASLNLTNTANRTQTNVTHMFVHHSAGHTNSNDFAAVVRSYHILHTQTNGWADIGYNWLVDGNGVIYQGRAFTLTGFKDVIGAHTGGSNTNSMGVCVIGHYSSVMPTSNAINSLMSVLAWKAHEKNIDVRVRNIHPFTNRNYFTISGHRDGSATECPGQRLYNYLPTLRNRTHAYLNPPEIEIVSAEETTTVTTIFNAEIGIRNFEVESVVYLEYGIDPEELADFTDEVLLSPSPDVQIWNVQLTNLMPATTYYYRVVGVNTENFTVSELKTFTTASPTSIGESELPSGFVLEQNYPNPFNPATSISFELPQPASIRVLVYNSQGQMIAVPTDRSYSSGRHSVSFDASGISSGVLIYALEVDGIVIQTRKMLLLR